MDFPDGSVVKNLRTMQEAWQEPLVWSLDVDDILAKGMKTHSSILGLGNPMDREAR